MCSKVDFFLIQLLLKNLGLSVQLYTDRLLLKHTNRPEAVKNK